MRPHNKVDLAPSVNTVMSGILGNPLDHTLSPAMHMAAFKKAGIDALFVPFPIKEDEIEIFLKALPSLRFIGLSVTMPYKKAVLPFMDELDISARQCGSVNVIKVSKGKLIGYNTDGRGFVQGLVQQAHFNPVGKHCVILGAGGSARGIAFALVDVGVDKITILNRAPREYKASNLACDINSYKPGVCVGGILCDTVIEQIAMDADCIINTTPAGMEHIESRAPFDLSKLLKKHMVCDIVYKPHITPLLEHARSIGCEVLEGYWMLVYQGVLAWQLWTECKEVPIGVMAEIVQKSLD